VSEVVPRRQKVSRRCAKRCLNVSDDVPRFLKVSEGVQGVRRFPKLAEGVPRWHKVSRRCSKMSQGVRRCPKVSEGFPRWQKVSKCILRSQKVSFAVPRCPKV
jgi:hypothetical protein